MMEWKKAPEELVLLLAQKMRNVNCDFKKMFGYPTYFINGNMLAGVHGDLLFLRLPETDAEAAMKTYPDVKRFEPRPGYAMRGYFSLPKSVYTDDAIFAQLLEKSVKYTSSLPPKLPKAKKK